MNINLLNRKKQSRIPELKLYNTLTNQPNKGLSFTNFLNENNVILEKQQKLLNCTQNCSFFKKYSKCKCDQEDQKSQICRLARGWIQICNLNIQVLKQKYYQWQIRKIRECDKYKMAIKNSVNILIFQKINFICKYAQVQNQIINVLQTLAKYNQKNYILPYQRGYQWLVASFLYHSEEFLAFWFFVKMFQHLKLDQVYRGQIDQHCREIQIKLKLFCQQTYHFLVIITYQIENDVQVKQIAWRFIRELFLNLLPVQVQGFLLGMYFRVGWNFFYSLCCSYIQYMYLQIVNKGWGNIIELIDGKGEVEWPIVIKNASLYCEV